MIAKRIITQKLETIKVIVRSGLIMKKVYVGIMLAFTLIISFLIGYYIYKINRLESNFSVLAIEDECTQYAKEYELGLLSNTVNGAEDKISPNAQITKKIYYKDCGHTINKYETVENDVVNLNRQELQEKYQDWKIEEFSDKQIIMSKEEEDSCNEHYMLREKDGNIAIYIINDDGEEKLKETTTISMEYLTETDTIKLKAGIRVNGMEELNSALEDFE